MELDDKYNPLSELQETISEAPQRITEEFNRSANSWSACYGTSVFQLETILADQDLQHLIPEDTYARARRRLESIKEELAAVKQVFPNKDDILPANLTESLIQQLDVLRAPTEQELRQELLADTNSD